MQIRDQLDECCERYREQQAHHTPQPAPEENPNRCRHRPDTHAIGNKFRNQEIRGHDMQEENGQSDDNIWSRCAELKESRRKRKRKRSDQSEERQQIQESADVTGEICTKWNERESTWRKSGSCQSRGTSQDRKST